MTSTTTRLTAAALVAWAQSTGANERKHAFDIPAQPLTLALQTVAAQSGAALFYAEQTTAGRHSPRLNGSYTTGEAVDRLLAGTPLIHSVAADGTVTVKPAKPAPARPETPSLDLSPVEVSADAGPADGPDTQPYQAKTSTAGSKIPIEIERLPQSVQVVTEEAIRDEGAIGFSQVFKNIPSANVGQSRFARYPNWTVRGFPVRIQTNGFRQLLYEGVDTSALSNVENFEVLKGPGSAIYGQGGLGGLVNLTTKRPQRDFQGYISGTYGEYDLGLTDFDVTGPLLPDGSLSGRIAGQIERSGTFVHHQNMDRENLALNLRYDGGGPVRAFLVVDWRNRRTLPNPGLPAVGTVVGNGVAKVSRKTYLGEPGIDKLEDSSPVVQSWLDIEIAPDWVLSPRFQWIGRDGFQDQFFLGAVEPDGITVNRTGRRNFSEQDRTYLGQIDLKGRFNTFGLHHRFLAGLEYEDHRWNVAFNPYTQVSPINTLSPVYSEAIPPIGPNLTGSGRLQDGSFYLQDLVSLTPELDFLGGMRHTQISGATNYWFGDTDLETDVTMFNVGASYQVWDGVSLFAGYGTGTDFDSFGALTFSRQPYTPVETDQKEMGVKLKLPQGVTGTLSLFEIHQSSIITPDPLHPGFSTFLGQARSRGVEAEFNWQVSDEWYFQGGYAFLDARITQSGDPAEQGNRLRNVAEHQANLWTRYEFKDGMFKGLGFGAGGNYVGKRPGNNFSTFDLPAYTTVDLSTAYQWRNFKAEIFALNLLDKRYFTASDFGVDSVFAGTPRTVYGRVTISF